MKEYTYYFADGTKNTIESDMQVELWKVTYHLCAEKREYSATQELMAFYGYLPFLK